MHLKIGPSVYYVYIASNKKRTVFQASVTGDLTERIARLENEKIHNTMLYWEHFMDIEKAMERVAEINNWSKKKKMKFIDTHNPGWNSLNEQAFLFRAPFNSIDT